MRYMIIIILALSFALYLAINGYIDRGVVIKQQYAQIEVLRSDIQRRDKNDAVKQERKEEVKKVIKQDKSGFDWSYNISDSSVVKLLQTQCKSCSSKTN